MSAAQGNGVADHHSTENGAGPSYGDHIAQGHSGKPAARPEIAVGAAFAGGFLLAMLLRRMRS